MPLMKNDDNPAGKLRQDFMDQKRKHRTPHDHIVHSNTPSHQPNVSRIRRDSIASNDGALSNPIGARDLSPTRIEKLQKAKAMKMNLPAMIESQEVVAGNKSSAAPPDQDTRRLIASGQMQRIPMRTERQATFDDNMSLTMGYESTLPDDEQNTAVFHGLQAEPQHNNTVTVVSGYNQEVVFAGSKESGKIRVSLPNDWPEISRRERLLQEQEQAFESKDKSRAVDIGHRETEEHHPTLSDTPSRIHSVPPDQHTRTAPLVKAVAFRRERSSSPELELPNAKPVARPTPHGQPSRQGSEKSIFTKPAQPVHNEQGTTKPPFSHSFLDLRGRDRVLAKASPINTFNSVRASDYPASSSDDEPHLSRTKSPTPPVAEPNDLNVRKRQREEGMDYNIAKLKTMKYDDLQKQNYNEDPNNLNRGDPFHQQNDFSSRTQRFNDSLMMTEDDQKTMFRNQSDEEWTQMGSWFIDRFQESLQKLVQVRIERRKVSLKFENEIRKRQRDVEQCSASVEEELESLRRGGGELIKGRDAPSRTGTPQRR